LLPQSSSSLIWCLQKQTQLTVYVNAFAGTKVHCLMTEAARCKKLRNLTTIGLDWAMFYVPANTV